MARRRRRKLSCPKCGSSRLRRVKGEGKSYSGGVGLLGCLVAGPVGLVLGLLGAEPDRFKMACRECGHTFLPPAQRRQQILRTALFLLAMAFLIILFIMSLTGGSGTSSPVP